MLAIVICIKNEITIKENAKINGEITTGISKIKGNVEKNIVNTPIEYL